MSKEKLTDEMIIKGLECMSGVCKDAMTKTCYNCERRVKRYG